MPAFGGSGFAHGIRDVLGTEDRLVQNDRLVGLVGNPSGRDAPDFGASPEPVFAAPV